MATRKKLISFVRLHLVDGNENGRRKEIDKSWIEALKIFCMIRSQVATSLSKPCRRIHPHSRCFTFICTFISVAIRGNGFTMAAANLHSSKTTESPADSRESGTQLRPGLWQTINERYPSSMITRVRSYPWRSG